MLVSGFLLFLYFGELAHHHLRPAQLWDWQIFSLLHQDVFTEQTLANLFIELLDIQID